MTQELAKSIQDNWTHVDDLLGQVNSLIANEGWQTLDSKVADVAWIDRIDLQRGPFWLDCQTRKTNLEQV